ncbi:RHS repeat domain-containing protein [Pseudomonas japonica]|uniref:RHS repeat domain-containing protein n=1 Tax=Pseudomonas japonica TaxID=256466 RepID=UPI00069357E4|nr:RHS repeat-associated core domain-containing protein [Pseudomonas japonica]
MARSPHTLTPDLSVIDCRHLPLRHVGYSRAAADQPVQRRVTLSRHDLTRQSRRDWDPRLFERLDQGSEASPNQLALSSLSGRPLLGESSDAGWLLTLPGEAGQATQRWDSRASHWHTEHDELLRPVLTRESTAGQAPRVAERFTYARQPGRNGRGRLVRHDDDGGSRRVDAYSLSGQEQRQTRHFLASPDLPDWPVACADRDALLEPGKGAATTCVHGPLQDVLEQTDALGNRQVLRFTADGAPYSLTLHLANASEHVLLSNACYNAFGQIEAQTAGNGVSSHCEYDPASGRLCRLGTRRPGRGALLQDLHYTYDPVGNLVHTEDRSQPVRHFANQRVDPVDTFRYDSLYQLVEATGREAAGALVGPQLPDLAPNPGDTSRLLNYSQHYTYDASGNLLTLRHVGQNPYTRSMAVAEQSNHAVPAPGDPLTAFDANGNLRELAPGQPLHWNAHNQLHGTRQASRDDGPDDDEHYRYGGDGLRVRKVANRLVSGRVQRSETRYLPGLELHARPGEAFAVITAQAGRCSLRCLVWSEGSPDGIDNPQLRYSLGDRHDSSVLELDGEARIISHEGYYPFGGTAWWAARSALDASYKTRRYSGKERDASGLYDYGLRYYAPWLLRWINPDPAGDVDGLNRYRFVRNNPATLSDPQGLNPEDRAYRVEPFSRYPMAPHSGNTLDPFDTRTLHLNADGKLAELVYDTQWSVKGYLDHGAANQIGDILRSGYKSMAYGELLRREVSDDVSLMERAAHAMAARAGYCDEFAAVGLLLLGSSPRWSGTPLYLAQKPGHTFVEVGDGREADPLIMDPWVMFPAVHHRSQSLDVATNLLSYTPSMPGDPNFHISRTQVDFLHETLYSGPIDLTPDTVAPDVEAGIRGGFIFSQWSAMQDPQAVTYWSQGGESDAAGVPEPFWNRLQATLGHDLRIRDVPGVLDRLLRI